MLFNSIDFLIFFPIVFFLHWFVFNKNSKTQNVLLLVCSYFFYGWWSWKFLILLIFSTLLDYLCGFYVAKDGKSRRKFFLYLSILLNISFLGIFKYFNFFISEFKALFSTIGFDISTPILDVAIPVGISFYTFHGMSYILDIYRNKRVPVQSIIDYSLFVAYFPLLVAGPIERANHLLPQIQLTRKFNYSQSVSGLRLILWGFFKKVVIADTLSPSVDIIFSNFNDFNGGVLFLGALYFTIQIYCDFSGYSDIAIGVSKLFGIELLSNFNYPYFSKNIAEFWKKWHISLTSWFREYLYIPLGGSKGTLLFSLRNIFIVFIVSGLWHGANLTFVFWGLWHACLYVPYFITKKYQWSNSILSSTRFKIFVKFIDLLKISYTFLLIIISWVFFRSDTILHAFQFIKNIVLKFDLPNLHRSNIKYVIILLVADWLMRKDERQILQIKNLQIRWICYLILVWFVVAHFLLNPSSFIYFQF